MQRDFPAAWREYICHGVVSANAAKVIRSFLVHTLAPEARGDDDPGDDEADAAPKPDEDVPKVTLDSRGLRSLLQGLQDRKASDPLTEEHKRSQAVSQWLWHHPGSDGSATDTRNPSADFGDRAQRHVKLRRIAADEATTLLQMLPTQIVPDVTLYRDGSARTLDAVMASICSGAAPPNADQLAFLQCFADKLKAEHLEERQSQQRPASRPLLDVVHGYPGTGKSRVIAWMRQLMVDGLGWKHGIQFVCLAFQNAMAAAIGGFTIHHWTGIPPCATTHGGQGFGDSHKMSTKCQCLRVMLIDELSMVSAELFGALEYVVRKVIRQRGAYKVRRDGSHRRFGGVNVVAFADFWQLPPVGGTSLFSNPTQASPGLAMDGMCLLWDGGEDSVRKCWSFEQPMRCVDAWYNEFLRQCRFGELSEDRAFT